MKQDSVATLFADHLFLSLCVKVTHSLKCHTHKHLKAYPLTFNQWLVLSMLHEQQVTYPSDIAKLLSINTSHVTKIVEHLYDLDFINRQSDSTDRRKLHITLTDQGKVIAEEVNILSSFSPNELSEYFTSEELVLYRHLVDLSQNS